MNGGCPKVTIALKRGDGYVPSNPWYVIQKFKDNDEEPPDTPWSYTPC